MTLQKTIQELCDRIVRMELTLAVEEYAQSAVRRDATHQLLEQQPLMFPREDEPQPKRLE